MKTFWRVAICAFFCVALSVAAELDGDWLVTFNTQVGTREAPMSLKVNGSEVSGKMGEKIDIKGTYSGGQVSLTFPFYSEDAGFSAELKLTGKLDGDKITGDWQFDQYAGVFSASRTK